MEFRRRAAQAAVAVTLAFGAIMSSSSSSPADVLDDCQEIGPNCLPVAQIDDGDLIRPLRDSGATEAEEDPNIPGRAIVGNLQSDYLWTYDTSYRYYLCNSSGYCRYIGKVRVTARINLNGRQSQFTMTSERWEGPAIKPVHKWDCVDDNGGWPNSSCSGGWQSDPSSNYITTGVFKSYNAYYHSENETYWYDFIHRWYAQGYGNIYWDPGKLTSKHFVCKSVSVGPCRFAW
jgi:hypothetical protein